MVRRSEDPGHPGDSVAQYRREDDIAAATGGHAFHGNNRIAELLDKAVENGTSYYSLTYSPTNTKYDGSERHIEVTLAKKVGYTLSYRTIYYGIPDTEPVPAVHKSEILQARFIAAKTADNLYANIEHGAPMLHDLLFSAHVTTEGAPEMATAGQMQHSKTYRLLPHATSRQAAETSDACEAAEIPDRVPSD